MMPRHADPAQGGIARRKKLFVFSCLDCGRRKISSKEEKNIFLLVSAPNGAGLRWSY